MRILSALRTAILVSAVGVALSGCVETGIMHEHARADNAANPGSVYSGAHWWALYPGDIAGIPESEHKAAAMTQNDVMTALDLDASCQEQAYHKTPDFGYAIGKGVLNGGVSTGGGEAGFSTQFAGTNPGSYGGGGAIIGGVAGGFNGAAKQEEGEKITVNACVRDFVNETRMRYRGHLEGVYPEPWVVDGPAEKPTVSPYQSTLPHVDMRNMGAVQTTPLQ